MKHLQELSSCSWRLLSCRFRLPLGMKNDPRFRAGYVYNLRLPAAQTCSVAREVPGKVMSGFGSASVRGPEPGSLRTSAA
jgi:hypothetical protein